MLCNWACLPADAAAAAHPRKTTPPCINSPPTPASLRSPAPRRWLRPPVTGYPASPPAGRRTHSSARRPPLRARAHPRSADLTQARWSSTISLHVQMVLRRAPWSSRHTTPFCRAAHRRPTTQHPFLSYSLPHRYMLEPGEPTRPALLSLPRAPHCRVSTKAASAASPSSPAFHYSTYNAILSLLYRLPQLPPSL